LFDELAEDENILDVLQLFDYLGINSFPLPLLKTEDLVLLNPIDIKDKKITKQIYQKHDKQQQNLL